MNMAILLSAIAMVCVVTSAFMWFLYACNRRIAGIISIALSNSFFAFGFGMIALRTSLSPFLSYIVANYLIFGAHILIIIGIQQFIGRKRHHILSYVLFVVYALCFSYWYYVEDNYRNRLILFLMTYATMMLYALKLTLGEYIKQRQNSWLFAVSRG